MSNSSLTRSKNKLEGLILKYNKKAMNLLRLEDFTNSLRMLKQSEQILDEQDENPEVNSLKAITFNNLGCFYKRTGKPNVALSYLKEALDKESSANADLTNLAGTNLNICAIYSELGRHETALGYALRALHLMKDSYLPSSNLTTTMVIGYHNAGAEYEFLNKRNEAIESYTAGYILSRDELGEDHPLTENLRQSLEEASDKLGKIEKLTNQRQEFRVKSGLPLATLRTQSVPRRPPSLPPCGPKRMSQSRDKTNLNKSLETELSPLSEEIPMSYNMLKQDYKPKPTTITLAPPAMGSIVRFITGDRKQPMFPDDTSLSIPSLNHTTKPQRPTRTSNGSSMRPSQQESNKNVQLKPLRSTITNIGDKLNNLQMKLSDFANKSKGLKDAAKTPDRNLTPSSTVSRVNGDSYRRKRDHAARIIQRWYRDILKARNSNKNKVNFNIPKTADRNNAGRSGRTSTEIATPNERLEGYKSISVPVSRPMTEDVKEQTKPKPKIDVHPHPVIELVPQTKPGSRKKADMKIQTSAEPKPRSDAKVQTQANSHTQTSTTPSMSKPSTRKPEKLDMKIQTSTSFRLKVDAKVQTLAEPSVSSKSPSSTKQPKKLDSIRRQPSSPISKPAAPRRANILKDSLSKKPSKSPPRAQPPRNSKNTIRGNASPRRSISNLSKPSPNNSQEKNKKAIRIQSIVRMFLIRKRYLRIRNAVIIIQKNIRRYQCQTLYKSIREAIIFIQANYRGHRAREVVKSMKANN
jgi:tetratricopeptide (TPR) repeat protein